MERWQQALGVWSEKRLVLRSWHYAHRLALTMPDDIMKGLALSLSAWMEAVSEVIEPQDDIMPILDLCQRIMALPIDADTGVTCNGKPIDNPAEEAINHPIGYVTETLINLLSKQKPNDNDEIPKELKTLFTTLCDVKIKRFQHARVLMGAQVIFFFRVDRPWTEQYLLPLFNWDIPGEAKGVWQGFLLSPRLYPPLMAAFKPQFLGTAKHYDQLGEHGASFAALLTYAALDQIDGYAEKDFRSALVSLPQAGLETSAQALLQALEGAAEKRENFWQHRVKRFWQAIWPKSLDLATPELSDLLARLAIASGDKFPEALETIKGWLKHGKHADYIVRKLKKSGLTKKFPEETLLLLSTIISNQLWDTKDLEDCLNQIGNEKPDLKEESSYKKLQDYARSRRL